MKIKVLVNTFDDYKVAWPIFCYGLNKYWPDCPYPVVFETNFLDSPCGECIKIGTETNWSNMLIKMLEQIDCEIILFAHEDFWLSEIVDTEAIKNFVSIIEKGLAEHIQLRPTWKPHCKSAGHFTFDKRLLVFASDSQYRTSNQAGLWRVSTLLSLLRENESAWDFEINGSKRSEGLSGFLGVEENKYFQYPLSPKGSPIVRGKWHTDAYWYAEREGLEIDFSRQPKE